MFIVYLVRLSASCILRKGSPLSCLGPQYSTLLQLLSQLWKPSTATNSCDTRRPLYRSTYLHHCAALRCPRILPSLLVSLQTHLTRICYAVVTLVILKFQLPPVSLPFSTPQSSISTQALSRMWPAASMLRELFKTVVGPDQIFYQVETAIDAYRRTNKLSDNENDDRDDGDTVCRTGARCPETRPVYAHAHTDRASRTM